MTIVVKEVIVKTTVELREPQWSQPSEEIVKVVKQEVLAELAEYTTKVQSIRKRQKDR